MRLNQASIAQLPAALRDQITRQMAGTPPPGPPAPAASPGPLAAPQPTPTRSKMNRLEAEFAALLDIAQRRGVVAGWGFEVTRLRLAHGAWYTPDFTVWFSAPGVAVVHYETKGFWREAALLRIKVAADRYPCYAFVAVRKPKRKGCSLRPNEKLWAELAALGVGEQWAIETFLPGQ